MRKDYRALYEEDLTIRGADAPGGFVAYFADGDEEIVHVNDYIVSLFECDSVDQFLEYTKGSFKHFVYKEDLQATEDSIWGQVQSHNGLDHVYYRIRTRSGRLVTVADYGRLIENDRYARPLFYCLVSEVTPMVAVDWLTGLPSMVRFIALTRLGSAAIFDRGERPCVAALDIMGMMSFNTRYGRDEGDRLLRAFADVLRKHFGNEACSRFDVDHFYAFCGSEDVEERVYAVFEDFRMLDFERVPPIRCGLYELDPDDDIVAVGFDRAKSACDLDRKTWASHLNWFSDEMRRAARLRIHVLDSLDQAIAEGWIRPYYQAVVRSATGDICNEEALARWIDPEFGSLVPAQFIPDLEEAGLLWRLDLHIVDCVIADLLEKRARGVTLVPVSMNFSLRDLHQLDLAHEIGSRADAAGLPRSLLRIELTESVASSDPVFLREQIAAMHEAGFEVWMDDFGSGYSSLNTLQEFDFDLIKLDMGFLRSAKVERSHVILAGVVQAAAMLGVGTLTEGVETAEQAEFLASIGCDMLQGYFYAKPQGIDEVLGASTGPNPVRREKIKELDYWNSVSLVSFTNLTEQGKGEAGWVPMSEFPVAVLEQRGDVWSIVRANVPYIDFVTQRCSVEGPYSDLEKKPLPPNIFDPEFYSAAAKAKKSGTWERIFGRKEYGSGYQFYIRHLAGVEDVDAFQVSAAPTMLGSALGAYGDVPVSYAVFRVVLDEAGTEVVDTEYVYANELYCEMVGRPQDEIIGSSFLTTMPDAAADMWFPYCYRAAMLGQHVHDIVWSPEIEHWLSFNLAPSLIEGCCVYAFTYADSERRERDEMKMDLSTSDLIIRIADELNSETSYEAAMQGLLATISEVIHCERLYVFERMGERFFNTFEWCADGVEPQIDTLQDLDSSEFDTWERLMRHERVVVIPDVEEFREIDPQMYWQLSRQNITHLLAVPFYSGDTLLGYLGADNYLLQEGLDSIRLLQTVASFVSARIMSKRLMDALERLGTHDELTGMLSRRGVDLEIDALMRERPNTSFSLVLMDVDDFKTTNDVYGHDMGDAGLTGIARHLETIFSDDAVIGRNGGDEFLVLVPGDDGETMAEGLAAFYAEPVVCERDGVTCQMSVSAGYVCYPAQVDSLRGAYTKADAALFAAKLAGKGHYRRYHHSMETQYRTQTGFTPKDVAESVPASIVVHRPGDGEILFANDELVRLFECADLDEFLDYTGGTFGGIVHPNDRERVRAELATQMTFETMEVGKKDFVDFRILTARGNVVQVADNGRLVHVEGVGDVFYELIVNSDERNSR